MLCILDCFEHGKTEIQNKTHLANEILENHKDCTIRIRDYKDVYRFGWVLKVLRETDLVKAFREKDYYKKYRFFKAMKMIDPSFDPVEMGFLRKYTRRKK